MMSGQDKNVKKRDAFTSRFGIIAAAAGSAIGLGNIWRFPYMAGENGGGAFILIFLGFVLLLGIPVMISEFIIGRRTQSNAFGAFKKLAPRTPWPIVGLMGVLAAFIILAFYSTIAGWTLHYVYSSLTNAFVGKSTQEIHQMFDVFFTSTRMPLMWQMLFLVLTASIILSGVKKGIEQYSKILMPFLLLLLLALCIRSLSLPGASEGLLFLFKPDFTKIDTGVLLSALGQAAFSLSIGMGALITYASYFPKENPLVGTAFQVSLADVFIAILAGVAIFPALFAFGMEPDQGVGLIFKVLPNIFQQMPGGYFVAIAFFVLLSIAALTSSISIMEVVVAFLGEEFRISRKMATLYTTLGAAFLGVFATMSWGALKNVSIGSLSIFDFLDFTASNLLLPLGGFLIVLFTGWYLDRKLIMEELNIRSTAQKFFFKIFVLIIRYFAPLAIGAVFLHELGIL